jgi:hypothetical protein
MVHVYGRGRGNYCIPVVDMGGIHVVVGGKDRVVGSGNRAPIDNTSYGVQPPAVAVGLALVVQIDDQRWMIYFFYVYLIFHGLMNRYRYRCP